MAEMLTEILIGFAAIIAISVVVVFYVALCRYAAFVWEGETYSNQNKGSNDEEVEKED